MTEVAQVKKVQYVRLGESGLKVSKIILGCMSFGNREWGGGWVLNYEESLPIIKAAYDLGIQTWDTANVYSDGDSERVLGRAIKELGIDRSTLVLASKVFYDTSPKDSAVGNANLRGLGRKHIFASVKNTLERLQTDYLDLLQCHRFDPDTPIAETMDALHDLVKLGLVRYIGMSSCRTAEFMAMQHYAQSKGQTKFISMQPLHNAIYREEERDMFLACKMTGASVIPWSPLARGFLTRPVAAEEQTDRAGKDPHITYMYKGAESASNEINTLIEKIAKDRGCTMAQVSVAWCLSNPIVAAPIVGTSRVESLAELVEASAMELTKEEVDAINKPYKPRPVA